MIKKLTNWWGLRQRRKHLREMTNHLRHMRHINDDLFTRGMKEKLDALIEEAKTIRPEQAEACMQFLEKTPMRVARILPKQRFPTLREYLDILAVACAVAFGIRGLYLQPFKIPTSSMQPTLFGIHYINEIKPDGTRTLPELPAPLHFALFSTQRAELTVKRGGEIDQGSIRQTVRNLIFPRTHFNIGGISYQLPGTWEKVRQYALHNRTVFSEDEELCRGWMSLGDHLFVDRFSHHFRKLKRGDIIVFNTEGIVHQHPLSPRETRLSDKGYYYIKRLVGLPGDRLRIENDKIYVTPKGSEQEVEISELDPKFAKIYSFQGGYQGHISVPFEANANYLCFPKQQITVPENHYFAMGDNSGNSFDSRYWGFIPRRNMVGRAFFVFWPLSRRWGIPDLRRPLPFPTSEGLPEMELQ